MKKVIFLFIFLFLINTVSAGENVSVVLHGEKTDVILGEDIILKLSVVNIIKKPIEVQVILIPPSGMSVTSSQFVTSGAGQYTSTFKLNDGDGKDIEVRIKTNQVGDFEVKGKVIYFFGNETSEKEEHLLSLPIKVKTPPIPTEAPPIEVVPKFGTNTLIIIGIIALLLLFAVIYIVGSSLKRQQKIKNAETDILIKQKENEADNKEDDNDIETWKKWKQTVSDSKKDYETIKNTDSSQLNSEKGGTQINIKNSIVKNSKIGGDKQEK